MTKRKQIDEVFDTKLFLFKITRNWYYILLCLILSFAIAIGVNRYTEEVFLAETTLLINEKTNIAATAAEMLYENAYQEDKRGLKNEEHVLKSSPLIYETVQDVGFYISYFEIGKIKITETFDDLPFKVINSNESSTLSGEHFSIEIIDENSFRIFNGKNIKEGTYFFGDDIFIKSTAIKIVLIPDNLRSELPNFFVEFHNLKNVVRKYKNNLVVKRLERESSILKLSLYDTHQKKAVAFLNQLTNNYIEKEIEEKNIASKNTIHFKN